MSSALPKTRVIGFVIASASLAVACGSGGDSAPGVFTIDFPTTAAAIAAQTASTGIQVLAFDTDVLGKSDATAAAACQTLVQDERSGSLNVKPVMKTALVSPCDLAKGQGSLPIPYGNYAFLAVAMTTNNEQLLIGCSEQTISATNTAVNIGLTLASPTLALPETSCTTLDQACGGSCK